MARDHVYHWKHGWIPLDHTAALSKAKGNHKAASKMLEDAKSPHAGIHSREHVAKAAVGLSSIPDAKHRAAALSDVHAAADKHNAHDVLPKALQRKGDDHVTLYHGTTRENAQKIRESGIDTKLGAGWLTVTDSKDQAAHYANHDGAIVEFRVPRSAIYERGNKDAVLWQGVSHETGGVTATAHAVRTNLPGSMVHNVHDVRPHPVGSKVEARQPGIDNVTTGEVVGHDQHGMVRVKYADRHGNDVVGTFNPSHVKASAAADFERRNNAHVVARTRPAPSAADYTAAAEKWKRDNPGKTLAGHEREVNDIADEMWRQKRLNGPDTSATPAQAASERERVRRAASHAGQIQALGLDKPTVIEPSSHTGPTGTLWRVKAHEVQAGDTLHVPSAMGGKTRTYRVEKSYGPKGDGGVNIDATDLETGRAVELTLQGDKKHDIVKRQSKLPAPRDLTAGLPDGYKVRRDTLEGYGPVSTFSAYGPDGKRVAHSVHGEDAARKAALQHHTRAQQIEADRVALQKRLADEKAAKEAAHAKVVADGRAAYAKPDTVDVAHQVETNHLVERMHNSPGAMQPGELARIASADHVAQHHRDKAMSALTDQAVKRVQFMQGANDKRALNARLVDARSSMPAGPMRDALIAALERQLHSLG